MSVECGICAALARSECVCDGAPRMVLAPRPPVSNVWPRDLFPERPEESEEAHRNRLAWAKHVRPAMFREQK